MKITIVQGPFLPVPPLLGGAIEKVFYPMGQFWASRGHQVTHVSRTYGDLPVDEMKNGVHYVRIASQDSKASGLYNKWLDLQYAWRVFKNLPPADILITHTFFLPILERFFDASQKHGAVFVHVGRFPKGQLKLYSRAARLQFPSTAVAAVAAQQAPGLQDRFTVIPYPLASFPACVDRKIPMPPYRLLYAGRVHPEKGLHLLLSALALLPSDLQSKLHLRVVGPHTSPQGGGGEDYLAQLKSLAQKTSAKIEFVGPIFDSSALAQEYEQADLFVYPSLADNGETFGLAPLEALSHGTPVIVSGLGCFGDFISAENGFVFDHHATHPAVELGKTIERAVASVDRFPARSKAAYATASNFGLEMIGERFIKEFEQVIAEKRKS